MRVARIPIGTFTEKMDLQPRADVSTPPSITPAAKAADETAAKTLRARFLSRPFPGKVTTSNVRPVAEAIAAPIPCTASGADEDGLRRGEAPHERGGGEGDEPDDEEPLATIDVGGAAAEEKAAGESQPVGADYPLGICERDPELHPHRRQGDLHYREIQDDHELCQHDEGEDQREPLR